jgi:hypothetical protein
MILHTLERPVLAGSVLAPLCVAKQKQADVPYAIALLRGRRERPASCAAEKRDEIPPSHEPPS